MTRPLWTFLAVLAVASIAAAVLLKTVVFADDPAPGGGRAEAAAEPSTSPAARQPSGPEVSYTSTCDGEHPQVFVTGDSSEGTRTGYRFISDVSLINEGDVDAVVIVRVDWHLVGGGDVGVSKVIKRVRAGAEKTIGFTKPATRDEIDRMRAHEYGDTLCSVDATAIPARS